MYQLDRGYMKLRVNDRDQARQLRQQGGTYSEIREVVPNLSKSTLSNWLKGIVLTKDQHQRITEKMRSAGLIGRQLGADANRRLRQKRYKQAVLEAERESLKKNVHIRSFWLVLLSIGQKERKLRKAFSL